MARWGLVYGKGMEQQVSAGRLNLWVCGMDVVVREEISGEAGAFG